MFKHYMKIHDNGIFLGFTKPSECQMAGKQIALTCLLRLRVALKSTINSKEFMDLNNFKPETSVLNNDNFASEMVLCPILWGINLSHIYAREVR